MDSWLIDHSLLTNLLKFVVNVFNIIIKKYPIIKKKPIFVIEKCRLSNIGMFIDNKSLISN